MGHLCVVRVEIMDSGQAAAGMDAGKGDHPGSCDCVGGGVGTASVGAEVEVGDSVGGQDAGCWEVGLGEGVSGGLSLRPGTRTDLQGVWQ